MYVDNPIVQKQAKPFVYIQYPNNNTHHTNQQQSLHNSDDGSVQLGNQISSSVSSSSSSSPDTLKMKNAEINRQNPHILQTQQQSDMDQPKKKKRQHVGYACDKCRERRVGCDRGKPICGQCKDRYQCQYSNHALRLDNVSMRQRLDELENQVGWLTSVFTNLEHSYRTTVPRIASHVQGSNSNTVVQQQPASTVLKALPVLPLTSEKSGLSVVDWAVNIGWPIIENENGMRTIFTRIKSFEDLIGLKKSFNIMNGDQRYPLYRQPSAFDSSNSTDSDFSSPDIDTNLNMESSQHRWRPALENSVEESNKKGHTFTLFESLNRYSKGTTNHNTATSVDERYLEIDVMTRLINQHHKCGFPTLVSPSRFESHYRQGQLKPLVLSSVFSHSVPHCCIYHPHLAQIQDFRELGDKFYNHSHDLLGIDEPANLSNIHQRTLLITYDLDLGRVRRAFLHIGIAIRMCFMLNLHRPEGYIHCKSAFEREQSKRIFWTVWFYDNMVSHLFHDQISTIKLDQILIELPTPLPEFSRMELDQCSFAISIIQIRKLAGSISEAACGMEPRALVDHFKHKLRHFYHQLPSHLQFGISSKNQILPPDTSIWSRRNYFCILLDYCLCWITLYKGLLPPAHLQGERLLNENENEAILHVSQAAVAIMQLFQYWFQSSVQSSEGFDCFFRPYLYHFMSAKYVFSANVAQYGRTPELVYISRAYLNILLQLYRTTPTRRSFEESQLEKDIMQFLVLYQIGVNEVAYQQMIDDALMDDPSADGGWSIFSAIHTHDTSSQDDLASRCSSNSSILSNNDLHPKIDQLDLDYF